MLTDSLILGAIIVPLLGAFLLPITGKLSPKFRNGLALLCVLIALACNAWLISFIFGGKTATVTLQWAPGISFAFYADTLAVFMATVSSFISAVIVFYSWGYINHYEHQNEYYLTVVLFLGGMMGICYSQNLILLYLFWEITGIASWRLIGFFRKPQYVIKADKAFLVTVFGALAMLLGFVMVAVQAGSFDLLQIKASLDGKALPAVATALILAGILSKSATLPFHTWLPDAGIAPSPVTALLHAAVLVKIGVYFFARLYVITFPLDEFWQTAIPYIAAASTLISAGAAFIEKDIKRIIAYSTISQIGYIFLAFSLKGDLVFVGGMLYILMHGIAKAGLFLCAGIIEQNTGTKDISALGGLIKTMPITAVSFLLCAFSVMGIPPFGGFFSKYFVIAGALGAGHTGLAILFTACGFFTIAYLLRLFNAVFLKPATGDTPREGSPVMVASVALLGILSLAGGILVSLPVDFIQASLHVIQGASR